MQAMYASRSEGLAKLGDSDPPRRPRLAPLPKAIAKLSRNAARLYMRSQVGNESAERAATKDSKEGSQNSGDSGIK